MRRHFCTRHYDQGLSFNGDRSYDKCELCMLHVRPARLAKHQESKLCQKGKVRREKRDMIAAAQLPAPTFYVEGAAVERVTKFRYLGRILSQDDHDFSACVRNIQREGEMGCCLQGPEARGSVEEVVCEVLPCDREHGSAIRKRHVVGCHSTYGEPAQFFSQPMPQAHYAKGHSLRRC
jgi:hypothetical protein